MADKAEEKKPSLEERAKEAKRLLLEALKVLTAGSALAGFFTTVIMGVTPNGRRLIGELKEAALNLSHELGLTEENFDKLSEKVGKIGTALQNAAMGMVVILVGLAYGLAIWSLKLPDVSIRARLLPVAILLALVTIWFVRKFLPAVLAITAAQFVLSGKERNAKFAEKFLRVMAKVNVWYFFGTNIIIAMPFHNAPQLMWIALGFSINYPGFCNAWERGQSEYLRRTILWATAFVQIVCTGLTEYPGAVHWLMMQPQRFLDPHTYVGVGGTLFLALLALLLGTRRTREDEVRIAVTAKEAAGKYSAADLEPFGLNLWKPMAGAGAMQLGYTRSKSRIFRTTVAWVVGIIVVLAAVYLAPLIIHIAH